MAKTPARAKKGEAAEGSIDVLIEAVRRGTLEEKRARLRRIGIVTSDGKLAPRYKNWGSKVSRTPES